MLSRLFLRNLSRAHYITVNKPPVPETTEPPIPTPTTVSDGDDQEEEIIYTFISPSITQEEFEEFKKIN